MASVKQNDETRLGGKKKKEITGSKYFQRHACRIASCVEDNQGPYMPSVQAPKLNATFMENKND